MGIVVSIHKKGDVGESGNHRAVARLSTVEKIGEILQDKRLGEKLELQLCEGSEGDETRNTTYLTLNS